MMLPAFLLGMLLASCTAQRGLVPLEKPPPLMFQDDGTPTSLDQAVDGSIQYYQRLPETARFSLGGEVYSPQELITALQLFRALRQDVTDPAAFNARLTELFTLYESKAEDGDNLFTGYYEPTIPASETPTTDLSVPLYARPSTMVEVRLDRFGGDLPSRTLVGRVRGGELVPFYSRKEIQDHKALEGQAQPLAYVNDVDLFFLQIQGSGILRFPDGREIKVGYVASNGHPYRSIGAVLLRRNELTREEISLQTIRKWLADHPDKARDLLFANPSYTFFQIQPNGPLGNIRVPLTAGRSLAVDHRLYPPGLLAYIVTQAPVPFDSENTRPISRFMLLQDTGGAIRGYGRADIFWGTGPEAEWIAGHQKTPGRLLILVPKKAYLAAHTAKPDTHDPSWDVLHSP